MKKQSNPPPPEKGNRPTPPPGPPSLKGSNYSPAPEHDPEHDPRKFKKPPGTKDQSNEYEHERNQIISAINIFTDEMKLKMLKKAMIGYRGWNDVYLFPDEVLNFRLKEHIKKGDPVDIANFCMMKYYRKLKRKG